MSPAILPETATAEQIVSWAIETYKDHLAVVTSFQYEGMVIVDMAARMSKDVRVITLDTGRLPAETFDMIEAVRGGMELPLKWFLRILWNSRAWSHYTAPTCSTSRSRCAPPAAIFVRFAPLIGSLPDLTPGSRDCVDRSRTRANLLPSSRKRMAGPRSALWRIGAAQMWKPTLSQA